MNENVKATKQRMTPRIAPHCWKAHGITVKAVPAMQFQVLKIVMKEPCLPLSSTRQVQGGVKQRTCKLTSVARHECLFLNLEHVLGDLKEVVDFCLALFGAHRVDGVGLQRRVILHSVVVWVAYLGAWHWRSAWRRGGLRGLW